MGLLLRLMGPPRLERDGTLLPRPRGHKPWALLAYVALSRRAPSRTHLAELLFADAADPLRALRWSLSELRRRLGQPDALAGDPVQLWLTADTDVDVRLLASARPGTPLPHDLGGELLEGLSFPASPSFEAWLLIERRHVAALVEGLLRERVLMELGAMRPREATEAAATLVATNPLEEGHHELLVRCLVEAGDHTAARERVAACEELLRRELGTEPSARLRNLLRAADLAPSTPPVAGRSAARAQLDAGRAAIAAGEVEAGLLHLRRARASSVSCGDEGLQARALLILGSTLVHAVRGHDEGAATLLEAVSTALRAGSGSIAATAYRELGFIEVQAGRRERAEVWLARAEEAANGADDALAAIYGVRGMNLSDAARYPAALEWLDRSVEHARRCDDRRQVAWSTSLIGRVQLLTGRGSQAREALDLTLELVEAEQWVAFLPWPATLRAELDVGEGRVDEARGRLEHAFTMACHLADPCWEGASARGLGVVEERRGRIPQALAWLDDARARCTRVPAPWEWVHGFVLDAMCDAALAHGDARAARWVSQLGTLAARADTRELAVRAQLHRHRMGEPGALEAARLLAEDVDNPALDLK